MYPRRPSKIYYTRDVHPPPKAGPRRRPVAKPSASQLRRPRAAAMLASHRRCPAPRLADVPPRSATSRGLPPAPRGQGGTASRRFEHAPAVQGRPSQRPSGSRATAPRGNALFEASRPNTAATARASMRRRSCTGAFVHLQRRGPRPCLAARRRPVAPLSSTCSRRRRLLPALSCASAKVQQPPATLPHSSLTPPAPLWCFPSLLLSLPPSTLARPHDPRL